jgi:hypothetical protein
MPRKLNLFSSSDENVGGTYSSASIFFNSHSGGWSPNWVHSARRPLIGLLYLPRVTVRMENLVELIWQGKQEYSEKSCPNATLSTINPTSPDPGSNPGRRGGKPATNRLSSGAANLRQLVIIFSSNFAN